MNKDEASRMYSEFILCAVAADGRFAEEEFALVKPVLQNILGRQMTFDDAMKWYKESEMDSTKGFRRKSDELELFLAGTTDEIKEKILFACIMICAVDGNVSRKERKWLEDILA